MGKTILLIEADEAFAGELGAELERRGAEVKTTADGKEGLRIAQEGGIDAIVLCVELPKMSGYAVCNKLKKNANLKEIPLVITSSEATEKTFEQHKKLKTRAEDYVIKPATPELIADKLDALIGLPAPSGETGVEDEEIAALEDAFSEIQMGDEEGTQVIDAAALGDADEDLADVHLEALEVTDSQVEEVDSAELAIEALGADEPLGSGEAMGEGEEEDEAVLALESLEVSDADLVEAEPSSEEEAALEVLEVDDDAVEEAALESLEVSGDDIEEPLEVLEVEEEAGAAEAAASSEPEAAPTPVEAAPSSPSPGAGEGRRVQALEEENERLRAERSELRAKVDALEDELRALRTELEVAKAGSEGSSTKEVLVLKGELTRKDKEILSLKEQLNEKEKASLEWQERENELQLKIAEYEEASVKNEAQLRTLNEKTESQAERLQALQEELEQAQSQARRARELEAQVEDLNAEKSRLEGQVAELGERLAEANRKASEAEARLAELEEKAASAEQLKERVEALEAENAKNEERVLKAYQRLKGDEVLRDKTRKALMVALQLLDETPEEVELETSGEVEVGGEEAQA